jgi:hypothetical protein
MFCGIEKVGDRVECKGQWRDFIGPLNNFEIQAPLGHLADPLVDGDFNDKHRICVCDIEDSRWHYIEINIIESEDDDGNPITIVDRLELCGHCHHTCKECSGAFPNQCLGCHDASEYPNTKRTHVRLVNDIDPFGFCVRECISGYYEEWAE